MIQRIQTVFLLLVGLIMIVFLFSSLWEKVNMTTGESYKMHAFYLEKIPSAEERETLVFTPYLYIGIAAFVSALIAFFEISMYRNRLTQIKLGALNALIMAGVIVSSVYMATQGETKWMPEMTGDYQFGLFLPIAAIILNMMANRFIRRDEMLVRSVDRMR